MNVGGIVKMVSPTIYEFIGIKYRREWRKRNYEQKLQRNDTRRT